MSRVFRSGAKQNYKAAYQRAYAQLGFPLRARDASSERQIRRAERKLGIELPRTLRDFYLVAGREKILRTAFQNIRGPDELAIERGKLVFVDENQGAVVWGLDLNTPASKDPTVFQGAIIDDEVHRWYRECDRCSTFLIFMLHLQAAYGGAMSVTASAQVAANFRALLKNWNFAGAVNGMYAFSRPNQAVCVAEWHDPGQKRKTWRAFAGAHSREALCQLAAELKLQSLCFPKPAF
ncbi:MAG TPA: SMI1/KNR4 family protein [Verrucomicrobiae bacterium]|nr:SMI1/KNR4 family protein [Verrucomicrobiae bacterium]